MQRVVRSTLAGLLTIAAITACGDKVTIPPTQTTLPGTVVHSVTVSPQAANITVGGSFTFAASVDADAGVSNRTVTWSSSDATVATVDATGKVTGVKAGTASIKATSVADPSVSGAAAITVGSTGGGAMSVQIVSVNQTNAAGQSVPANVLGAAGQLDILVNVDPNGQTLKSVSVQIKSGNDSVSQTQTFTSNQAPVAGEASSSVLTFSFNTAAFNATTGIPALHNGTATITATATSTTTTTPSATTSVTYVLANADGTVITNSFASYTNAEGNATLTQAVDANGLTWRGGAVTVSALPVLYSGRTISALTVTLPQVPGGNIPSQSCGLPGGTACPTSGASTFTWSATSTSGSVPRVTQLTLFDPINLEANGITPKGIVPFVVALDAAGNDLGLITLNPTITGAQFRLDNTSPEPPTSFLIPGRQANWINGSYTFGGTGGASFSTTTGTTKYVSCGDGVNTGAIAGYVCGPQSGVSAGGVSGTSGTNGLTTFTWYVMPAASYTAINTAGTSTSSTTCSTSGWTKVSTGGDLAGSALPTQYVVRGFETDKLGNSRCVDLGTTGNTINTVTWTNGKFGVDKIAPTAVYVDNSATTPNAANANGIWNAASVGTVPANFDVTVGYTDDPTQPSGFATLPVTTMVQRLYIDPVTLQPSNFNTTNGCPTGLNGSGVCTTAAAAATVPGWYANPGPPGSNGGADASGCVGCGYYIFSQSLLDNARNSAPTFGPNSAATVSVAGGSACTQTGCRQVLIDVQVPVMGGVAVPATIIGGTSVSFATSATDNLDLLNTDNTLLYAANPSGNPIATLPIRSLQQTIAGAAAFDNVLTTSASFAVTVPNFIRNMATTTAGGAPQNNGVLPTSITVRAYDAAGNPSAPVTQLISAVNVPQTSLTNFAAAQPSGAVMTNFAVTNAATNISNGPTTPAANPTTVTLTASLSGSEGPAFQYINPFVTVQFYYFDTVTNEWINIGAAAASTVTDNATVTLRTFTYQFANWDPPAALGNGVAVNIVAVGVTSGGDALASAVNANIALTNP